MRFAHLSSEDIANRKRTEAEKNAVCRITARQAVGDDSHINFNHLRTAGRNDPAARPESKIAVSVRLDARVVEWLKRKGDGHLRRINDILANVMEMKQSADVALKKLLNLCGK